MKKILIVDDLEMNLDVCISVFSRVDCKLYTAKNGLEALEMTKRIRPDLIILDLFMPEMDGDECCRLIKEDAELSHIPIFMVAAGARVADEDRCYKAGCDNFIEKPYHSSDLMQKVASHLDIIVREYTRVSIYTKALLRYDNKLIKGYIHDLSDGGIFVESRETLEAGTTLDIEFTVPGNDKLIKAQGEVRWGIDDPAKCSIDNIPGMGIQFLKISTESKRLISDYIRDVKQKEQEMPKRRGKHIYKSEEYAVIDAFVEFCGGSLPETTKRKILE
ncbi:MAG: response regulator [bacterium]|nr:response regulator [bacterium]